MTKLTTQTFLRGAAIVFSAVAAGIVAAPVAAADYEAGSMHGDWSAGSRASTPAED